MRSLIPRDLEFVDAHHHFWDYRNNPYPGLQSPAPLPFRYGDIAPLKRDFLPADFEGSTQGHLPALTVHMEAEWDRADPAGETQWLDALHRETGRPDACVAHARLDERNARAVLAAHARSKLVRGVRHKPVTAAARGEARRDRKGSMDDARWRDGYAMLSPMGFSFDLQAPWWDLVAAADLARDFPSTSLIINHTGLPADRSAEGLAGWRKAMERCAREPNISVKISGLGLHYAPWVPQDNAVIVRDTIRIFGADRCMFASNFPVDSLVATYETILATFLMGIEEPSHRHALIYANAVRIYRLHPKDRQGESA